MREKVDPEAIEERPKDQLQGHVTSAFTQGPVLGGDLPLV